MIGPVSPVVSVKECRRSGAGTLDAGRRRTSNATSPACTARLAVARSADRTMKRAVRRRSANPIDSAHRKDRLALLVGCCVIFATLQSSFKIATM